MKELQVLKVGFCGVIFGMFAGGMYQAIPKPKIVHGKSILELRIL